MSLSVLSTKSEWARAWRESAKRDKLRYVSTAVAKMATVSKTQTSGVKLLRLLFLTGLAYNIEGSSF